MTAEHQGVAGRREWVGLAVLALPTLLLALDVSVLYLALPQLTADLAPSAAQQLWIMDVYGLMIAGFLVTMGTLGDRIGRRRLLLIGAAAFGMASVLAAFSTSAEMLIATRALMGIAGATLMPSTLALITTMFRDDRQRAVAISVWMSCFMSGMAIGPVVGGAILQHFWWGAAFLLGVPVMVLLLAVGRALLPETRAEGAGRIDLVSVGMSLVAILPVVYGLKEIATGAGVAGLLPVGVGLVAGVLFVRRQRTLADPLLDVSLFGNRVFRSALGVQTGSAFVMGGMFLMVNLYLQLVAGLSPLQAGLLSVPSALAMVVGTMAAPALAARLRPSVVIGVGMLLAGGAYLFVTQAGDGGLGVLITGTVIAALGMGPAGSLCVGMIIGAAPAERAGSASAVSETSAEFGIAFGVAALGSLGTAVYRAVVELPDGITGTAASSARDSFAGAVASVDGLPAPLAAATLDAARAAFVTGFGVVATITGVVFAALGVLALRVLRHADPIATAEPTSREPVSV